MFDVSGDELTFKNRVVAKLAPLPLGFLRDFEDTIRDYTSAESFEDEHREALEAEYDEGFEAGIKEGENEANNKLNDERTAIETKGFVAGRESAIDDMACAADLTRVENLLQALQEIHNALLPVALGYEQPGHFKRRPAKLSEAKATAARSCAAARVAINAFRAT